MHAPLPPAHLGPQDVRDNGSNDEGWNREHIWPKSHGFPSEGDEPHTDGHHLTACDKWVNNRRSDKDFDEGGEPICLLPLENPIDDCEVLGASTSSTFDVRMRAERCTHAARPTTLIRRGRVPPPMCAGGQVPEPYRGNVARMLFYLEVRYNDEFGLKVVNHTTSSSSTELGVLCTMFRWNREDPVWGRAPAGRSTRWTPLTDAQVRCMGRGLCHRSTTLSASATTACTGGSSTATRSWTTLSGSTTSGRTRAARARASKRWNGMIEPPKCGRGPAQVTAK